MWAWIKQFFWWKCPTHEWEEYTASGSLYRGCIYCDRLEKFEPDVGGWTSGHWDEVK